MRTVAVLALLVGTPALSQTCPSPAGWAKPTRHLAARAPEMKFALPTGTSHDIGLLPARAVKLASKTERKPKPGSTAGLAALNVTTAGKLDVILSTATYVDLVRDGRVLKSTGHSDFKSCPGLRKSVSFDVVPGRYIVQLTDAPGQRVRIATVLR